MGTDDRDQEQRTGDRGSQDGNKGLDVEEQRMGYWGTEDRRQENRGEENGK